MEDSSRLSISGTGRHLAWLTVLALGALILVAAVDSTGGSGWMGFMAAGAVVTIALGTAVRPRGARRSASLMRHVEAGWEAMHSELARSRRHGRQLTIVALPEEAWTAAASDPAQRAHAAVSAASTVQGVVRRQDRAWADGSMLYVLLTDCDAQQGAAFLRRGRATMPQLFDSPGVRVAVFPEDGITLGALLSKLRPGADEHLEAVDPR